MFVISPYLTIYVKNLCKGGYLHKKYISSCQASDISPYLHYPYKQEAKERKKLRNNFRVKWNTFESDQYYSLLHLKWASMEEELIISVQKYPALYDKANTEG